MKTKPVLCLLLAAALAGPSLVFAATAKSPAQLQQQQRMKACNAEAKAKSLKGDQRRSFMSECLKADKSADADKQARRD